MFFPLTSTHCANNSLNSDRNTMQALHDLGWNGVGESEDIRASGTSGHYDGMEKSELNMSSIMDNALYNVRDQESLNPREDAVGPVSLCL